MYEVINESARAGTTTDFLLQSVVSDKRKNLR